MPKGIKLALKEIESALGDGLALRANNIALRLIPDHGENIRLLQLYGLSLARLGATESARGYLEKALRLDPVSGETAGILGRVYKDIFKKTAKPEVAVLSRDTYLSGYRASSDFYPGINAASMSAVIGETAKARAIALEIIKKIPAESESYWELATLGEAYLLTGNAEQAEFYYSRAVASGSRIGDINSSYHQVMFLQDYINIPQKILALLSPPGVVAFSGHMIDAPDRSFPRFPESTVPAIQRQIEEYIEHNNIQIGYCSAACGADILFAEALFARGGEVNILLPFRDDDFVRTSVAFAGERWIVRFRKVLQHAIVSRVTSEGYYGGDEIYRFLSKIIIGKAMLRASQMLTSPSLLTVSVPESASLIGGARDVASMWPFPERHVNIDPSLAAVDPAAVKPAHQHETGKKPEKPERSLPPGIQHAMKCILFADVVGYSRLQEDQTPFFMYEVLHSVAGQIAKIERQPEILNTWGDAFFAVYERSIDLIYLAKVLRDIFVGTDWSSKGLPAHLNIRIALHAGPVFIAEDPIRKEQNGYGSHINRTARIEPITVPGCIYASAQFAALLRMETAERYRYEYVGKLELPKKAGLQDVYHISC